MGTAGLSGRAALRLPAVGCSRARQSASLPAELASMSKKTEAFHQLSFSRRWQKITSSPFSTSSPNMSHLRKVTELKTESDPTEQTAHMHGLEDLTVKMPSL